MKNLITKKMQVFVLLFSSATFANAQQCKLVVDENFNQYSGGLTSYTEAMVKKDFGSIGTPKGLDGRTKVGNGEIRAFFPKNTILGQETGFTWFDKLGNDATEEAVMEYRLKFSDGFDWTKGGKLPGFTAGAAPRGCYTKEGYSKTQEGFSMRIMWRRDGEMATYAYWPESPQVPKDKSRLCGQDWKWSKKVNSNQWYTIKQYIKLNTPGKKDGIIRCYLDGELVQEKTDVKFRTSEFVTKIDNVYWTTYVGGSTQDFAPKKDQYVFHMV